MRIRVPLLVCNIYIYLVPPVFSVAVRLRIFPRFPHTSGISRGIGPTPCVRFLKSILLLFLCQQYVLEAILGTNFSDGKNSCKYSAKILE